MAAGNQFEAETLMWGERGLVATFFQDLSAAADFNRWNQFLQLIGLRINKLTHARTIVEPDFGQFGKPDAISLLVSDEQRYALITEAKRAPYLQSARHRNERAQAGFNSSINGQLELNHRLTLALSEFLPEMGPPLSEPDWVLATPYLVPRIGVPRRLWNPVVLGQVIEGSGLFGLSADHYCHLFITTDRDDPRTNELPEYLQPLLLTEAVQAVPFTPPRFLWTSWQRLHELFGESIPDRPCPPHFPPSYALNELNLQLPRAEHRQHNDWGESGVALVRLRQQVDGLPVIPSSYIHLSWKHGSAKLRNYSPNGLLVGPSRPLEEIIEFLKGERVLYVARPPVTEVQWWIQEIARLNDANPSA